MRMIQYCALKHEIKNGRPRSQQVRARQSDEIKGECKEMISRSGERVHYHFHGLRQ